jgi:hypothetical protein
VDDWIKGRDIWIKDRNIANFERLLGTDLDDAGRATITKLLQLERAKGRSA